MIGPLAGGYADLVKLSPTLYLRNKQIDLGFLGMGFSAFKKEKELLCMKLIQRNAEAHQHAKEIFLEKAFREFHPKAKDVPEQSTLQLSTEQRIARLEIPCFKIYALRRVKVKSHIKKHTHFFDLSSWLYAEKKNERMEGEYHEQDQLITFLQIGNAPLRCPANREEEIIPIAKVDITSSFFSTRNEAINKSLHTANAIAEGKSTDKIFEIFGYDPKESYTEIRGYNKYFQAYKKESELPLRVYDPK